MNQDAKIEAIQALLVADAETWAEAMQAGHTAMAGEFMNRVKLAAQALLKERTSAGSHTRDTSAFRALKPPIKIVFESNGEEWKGELTCPASMHATDITIITRGHDLEDVWSRLRLHARELARDEELAGPFEKAEYFKSLKWLDDHRKEYAGKWVALMGDKLVAISGDRLALEKLLEDNNEPGALLVTQVVDPATMVSRTTDGDEPHG